MVRSDRYKKISIKVVSVERDKIIKGGSGGGGYLWKRIFLMGINFYALFYMGIYTYLIFTTEPATSPRFL